MKTELKNTNDDNKPDGWPRWLWRLVRRPSYRIIGSEELRDEPTAVRENVGYEPVARWHSVHAAWQLGIFFECDIAGGMAQHYGYPLRHWLIMIALGRNTFSLGVCYGRCEWRVYSPNAKISNAGTKTD